MKRLPVLAAAIAALSCVHSGTARADDYSNAVDRCQGALPGYEDSLRKRPLAVANEGSAAVFVSCSMPSIQAGTVVEGARVYFSNHADTPQIVRCTLVTGSIGTGAARYYVPKSITVFDGDTESISWDSSTDTGGNNFNTANVSCMLPPGMEINTLIQFTP